MNRDVLFRGKRVDNGEWVYGLLDIEPCGQTHIVFWEDSTQYCFEVLPETIGQYTGLKDKNGVEIFEGDIGIRKLSKKHTEWVDYWQVVFDEKSAGFITVLIKEFRVDKLVDVDYELNSFSKRFNELEVIGNIHDE